MLSEWTISSCPGISPFAIAALASAAALLETFSDVVSESPGSGVATAGPAVSSAARRPAAVAATPRRLRRVR